MCWNALWTGAVSYRLVAVLFSPQMRRRAMMNYSVITLARSVGLFVVAGLCEIGGGWLIWKCLREGKPGWWGLVGGLVLVLYGVVPTLQPAHFGRVYAAYGGFFVVLSLLWGWRAD